jgi:hypothetical protein
MSFWKTMVARFLRTLLEMLGCAHLREARGKHREQIFAPRPGQASRSGGSGRGGSHNRGLPRYGSVAPCGDSAATPQGIGLTRCSVGRAAEMWVSPRWRDRRHSPLEQIPSIF